LESGDSAVIDEESPQKQIDKSDDDDDDEYRKIHEVRLT